MFEKLNEAISRLLASDQTKLEKASNQGPKWLGQVAMLTGVLAAFTGYLTVRSTNLTNYAIYESNQAVLAQAESSDAWAEYQADSIKARIIETQLMPSSPVSQTDRLALTKEDELIRTRQPRSKALALQKTMERNDHLKVGLIHLSDKDLLGYASMAAQLGIALASVAAMTQRKPIFLLSLTVGIAGVLIAIYTFIYPFLMG